MAGLASGRSSGAPARRPVEAGRRRATRHRQCLAMAGLCQGKHRERFRLLARRRCDNRGPRCRPERRECGPGGCGSVRYAGAVARSGTTDRPRTRRASHRPAHRRGARRAPHTAKSIAVTAWRSKPPTNRELRHVQLRSLSADIHHAPHGRYGYRRVTARPGSPIRAVAPLELMEAEVRETSPPAAECARRPDPWTLFSY